jgi:hypothetical protein
MFGSALSGINSSSSAVSLPEPISGASTSESMTDSLDPGATTEATAGVGGGTETLSTMSIGSRKSRTSSGSSGTQVTIHVNIAQASPEEAKKFARLVKEQLEEEKSLSNVGSR